MNKQELLQEITHLSKSGAITKDELLRAYESSTPSKEEEAGGMHLNISRLLSYLGGAIVFIGIAILIGENWQEFNSMAKVLATLGAGVALFWSGTLLLGREKYWDVGIAFHLAAALTLPLGLFVTFDVAGADAASLSIQNAVFGLLLVSYVGVFFSLRRILFLIFSIIFGTIFFFTLTNQLVSFAVFEGDMLLDFSLYRIFLVGLTYGLLGYGLWQKGQYRALTGPLYGFGVLAFLGAGLALGGWEPSQNVFWELIYPGLVFGVIFLSVFLKSKSFLVFGSIFLVAYIFKITAEYFANSLGWPFALVLLGFVLIGVGYLAVYLRNRYFH